MEYFEIFVPLYSIHNLLASIFFSYRELVRQKAVLCLHQFQLLAPDLLEHRQEDLERMLYDKDPGVMAAAVHIIQHAIEVNYLCLFAVLFDSFSIKTL
jgi:vesicle coat complex subunit